MNKITILFTAFFLISITAFSQSGKHQSNDHTQILKLGVNTFFDTDEFPFSISWEKKIATNESFQIGFLPRFSSYDGQKTSGGGINFAYRKYISKNRNGINGLFISPIVKVGYLRERNGYTYTYTIIGNPSQLVKVDNNSKRNQYSAGVVFGHNWVYKSGFSFELSGGMAYYKTSNSSDNLSNGTLYNNKYNESGILPQVQLGVGYAF
jgi:hypothetical protein